MNLSEAEKLISDEGLSNINWFHQNKLKANEVGIEKDGNQWIVYVTDERACVVSASISRFPSEDSALETLIRKARYGKNHLL